MTVSILDSIGNVLFTDNNALATQRSAVEGAVSALVTLDDAAMSGWNLQGANLTNATITNADLSNADLSNAICDGVNFSGSLLTGCNFSNTSMDGINLTGCRLFSSNRGLSKNNNNLIVLSLKKWNVTFSGANITILGFTFTRNQWNGFTQQQVTNNAGAKAAAFWLIAKPVVIGLSDLLQANTNV
jgi:uncharacterized protein YjbI with pentapeptide repeats